jgi:hypothetical protein
LGPRAAGRLSAAQSGGVGFPRLNVDAGFDLDRFYVNLLKNHGT